MKETCRIPQVMASTNTNYGHCKKAHVSYFPRQNILKRKFMVIILLFYLIYFVHETILQFKAFQNLISLTQIELEMASIYTSKKIS